MLQVSTFSNNVLLAKRLVAVGAHLSLFKFNHLKTAKNDAVPTVTVLKPEADSSGELNWETGVQYAAAQNLSRELMELPANMLTPTKFCERITKEFEGVKNVELIVREKGAYIVANSSAVLILLFRVGEGAGHGELYTTFLFCPLLSYV